MQEKRPPKLLKQLLSGLDYLESDNHTLIKKAYAYYSVAHENQARKTG